MFVFFPPPEPLSSENMVNIMNYQCWRRRVRLALWNGPVLRCCFVTRGAINGPNGCMNTACRARSDAPCSADGRKHCEPDRSLWRRVTNEGPAELISFYLPLSLVRSASAVSCLLNVYGIRPCRRVAGFDPCQWSQWSGEMDWMCFNVVVVVLMVLCWGCGWCKKAWRNANNV